MSGGGAALIAVRALVALIGVRLMVTALMRLHRSQPGVPESPSATWAVAVLARTGALPLPDVLRRRSHDAELGRRLMLAPSSPVARLCARAPLRAREVVAGLRLLLLVASLAGSAAVALAVAPAAAAMSPVVALGAAMLPDLVLGAAARESRVAMVTALPQALELLAGALDAGEPLETALVRVAAAVPPELGTLLTGAALRVGAGEPPGAALRAQATRAGVAPLMTMAALVDRQRALGLRAGPSLEALADAARGTARAAVLARAGRNVPIASLVIALVIAPACVALLVLLVVGGLAVRGLPGLG